MPVQNLEDLPIIGEEQVEKLLTWPPLIEAIEQSLIEFSAGNVAQPVRQIIPVPGEDAIIAAMPAIGEAMAGKLVTLYHSNAGTDLPPHQGVIMVFDKSNGAPLALMDGRLISEMRTAAGSAAVARKLAPATPNVVTIMGAGVQAKAHVAALANVRDWQELRLWARDSVKGQAAADEVGATFVADAQQAVRGADIIACTTAAIAPILCGDWLKPGAFVTAVGWNRPEGCELDRAAMANTVIVESTEAAHDQSGNIRAYGSDIFAEAGEIFTGAKSVPDGATIVFDSIGMAIMDVAAAKLVYDLWLDAR